MRISLLIMAIILAGCSIEDPSVAEFDLQRILLMDQAPFKAYFTEPEPYTYANKQADLFYTMNNGDTMKVSVCEFENTTLSKAFFYNSNFIVEKEERLIGNNRKRFFRWGRRVFIFSYQFSISKSSSTLDSLLSFTKKFPAADTSANADFSSMQGTYFLGTEVPFNMLVRRYENEDFSWFCARSLGTVSVADWENYITKLRNNIYGSDTTALIDRLPNGIVIAVYGDLDKKRMRDVYVKFKSQVK